MLGLQDLLVVTGTFGFFFAFLIGLLRAAEKTFNADYAIQKEDEFLKVYGYSWDYVLVFKVYDEEDKGEMSPIQKKFTMKNVIDRINNAGMETKCFYSVQRDEVYVKIRCAMSRLKEEASRINYKLLLDKNRLRVKAQSGKKNESGMEFIWNPITIVDEYKQSSYSPYEYIYGSFINSAEHGTLYQQYAIGDKKYPFKQVDRIKLIISILQNRITDEIPGAGLNIGEMAAKFVTLGQFPITNPEDLNNLQKHWLKLWQWPWDQPLDEVRDYFGERIGFYFLYLQHYCTALLGPAILGVVVVCLQILVDVNIISATPIVQSSWGVAFVTIMLVWSSLYVEFWKKTQSEYAMRWGMSGFEDSEQDRPLFQGIDILSPVDGSEIRYFPSKTKDYRRNVVNSITALSIMSVVLIIAGIYLFQYWVELEENKEYFTFAGIFIGTSLVGLALGLLMNILNYLYSDMAAKMNEWENHRTDTDFEDQLISKIFLFQLVNSFAALTYVAFFKSQFTACLENDCLGEVASTISTMFIATLVARMMTQVLLQMYLQHAKNQEETEGMEPGSITTPLEEQYTLTPYDSYVVTLQDYAALVIQYGFTILFVFAYPLAPTLAYFSSYIQIRVDGWKLCQAYQRPEPKSVEDIGVWQDMIEVLAYLSVMFNLGLLCFTSNVFQNLEWWLRWMIFLMGQNTFFFCKALISSSVDDISEDVQMQLDRQDFLTSKVIYDQRDEGDDNNLQIKEQMRYNIVISPTDYDWILPDDDEETRPMSKADNVTGEDNAESKEF